LGSSIYSLSQDDIDKILWYHNQIRDNYKLPPLTWDPALATNASKYAVGCIFQHSKAGKYGENLAQYSASPAPTFPLTTWLKQIDGWYGEYKYWNCMTGACSSVCGHLTQIISVVTNAVGCGIADCDPGTVSSMRSQYMVCQYTPQGNINLGSTHPVSGQPYPYNGCPGSNPVLTDKQSPVAPVAPVKPVAPLGQPIPTAPVSPTGTTPVAPNPTPTVPTDVPSPGQPYSGCKGDYRPNGIQKITPCYDVPKTFTSSTGVKKLYCDVRDPNKYLWPVINPGTPECNFVAKLEEDAAASSVNLPYYYWIGIALGILVLLIIVVVIIILVRKRNAADERV
jgi:hypothetical protein